MYNIRVTVSAACLSALIKYTQHSFSLSDLVSLFPQSPGRFYDELPNTADYVSYRLACNKEDYLEQHSPPIQPPLTFLPHNPYTQHSNQTAIFTYPTPSGPISSYTFPKEQYVWIHLRPLSLFLSLFSCTGYCVLFCIVFFLEYLKKKDYSLSTIGFACVF